MLMAPPRNPVRHLSGVLLLTMNLAIAASAQSGTTARLSGGIADPSGAAIAGALVTARNIETGLARPVESSSEGQYLFASLPPGEYELTVEARSFAQLRQAGVHLTVGQNATLSFALQVSGITQQLTVTADSSLTESARTEQSQVIEPRQIENLPINGRQFLSLACSTPNVGNGRSNVGNLFRPSEPNQIDLASQVWKRSRSLITVDGADNTNRTLEDHARLRHRKPSGVSRRGPQLWSRTSAPQPALL